MGLLAIAVVSAIAAVILLRAAPRLSFVAWAFVLFFVPIWVGFSAGYFFSAIALVTILCVASASTKGFRWVVADTLVLLFAAIVLASFVLGGVTLGHMLIAMLDWMLPYIWGRLALSRLGMDFIVQCIALATVVAAGLAVLEFFSHTNLFSLVRWDSSGYALWSPLQLRGGYVRVEGAFGHSISLGASLAMGSLFVLASKWPVLVRLASVLLVGVAEVMTFSRIGLISFALGLVLSLFFLRGALTRRIRVSLAVVGGLGACAALPFILQVFTDAGTEAAGSAAYRVDLIGLVPDMAPFGLSPEYRVLPNGSVYIGSFQSIDSALILAGLRLGWIPIALVVVLLIGAVVTMLRSSSNVPVIALVAQIPTVATIALITQLPYMLWFVAGLAVSMYILKKKPQAMSRS